MGNDNVCVVWVDNGQVEGVFAETLLKTLFSGLLPITNFIRVYGSNIARNRHGAVVKFMTQVKDADWTLWLDSDIQVSPETLKRIWDSRHKVTKPVVCGVYYLSLAPEGVPGLPTPSIFEQNIYPFNMKPVRNLENQTLIKIDYAGFGCTLIHRSVFDKLLKSYDNKFLFNETHAAEPHFIGEDVSFFLKLKEQKIPVHAYITDDILHLKKRFLTQDGWTSSIPQ